MTPSQFHINATLLGFVSALQTAPRHRFESFVTVVGSKAILAPSQRRCRTGKDGTPNNDIRQTLPLLSCCSNGRSLCSKPSNRHSFDHSPASFVEPMLMCRLLQAICSCALGYQTPGLLRLEASLSFGIFNCKIDSAPKSLHNGIWESVFLELFFQKDACFVVRA